MVDTIKMPNGLVCETQEPKTVLATCHCSSGLVPESVYVGKRFEGFHCRRCVRNYVKGK